MDQSCILLAVSRQCDSNVFIPLSCWNREIPCYCSTAYPDLTNTGAENGSGGTTEKTIPLVEVRDEAVQSKEVVEEWGPSFQHFLWSLALAGSQRDKLGVFFSASDSAGSTEFVFWGTWALVFWLGWAPFVTQGQRYWLPNSKSGGLPHVKTPMSFSEIRAGWHMAWGL